MIDAEIEDKIFENKNKDEIYCKYCNCLILKQDQGEYVKGNYDLPLMHQKNKANPASLESEPHLHFWVVDDMFQFENIGFTNTVDNQKFLICADCDMGPVGYHDLENKKCYLALMRVQHGESQSCQKENI